MSLDERSPSIVRLPSSERRPAYVLLLRLSWAVGLIVFVAALVYLDRDGYRDAAGGEIGLLDAFYYSTVSVTTTGYGDIAPVSDRARLTTTLLVTPARVLFLIILVGTTLEILADRTRSAIREDAGGTTCATTRSCADTGRRAARRSRRSSPAAPSAAGWW